ncbi:MAG: cheR40H-2 [Rhodocyclales bacterium]|nr:cheR40H-2 [Rhodocyclales bacterium]
MEHITDQTVLPRFVEFLTPVLGWSFPPNRWPNLLRGMTSVARELECEDAESCMQQLMQVQMGPREIGALTRHLTVGETYFFREPAVFEVLERQILPELIDKRRRAGNRGLRIWSAACCSGEEVYSLAILLSRLIPDLDDWHITLLGTDINPHALQRAEAAVYTQWSFRNVPTWIQRNYFQPVAGGRFALLPRIRRMVTLSQHNLVDDNFPTLTTNTQAMDLIFCRNALMYFDRPRVQHAVRNLRRSLLDDAWLIVGAAETDQTLFADFELVSFAGASLYRKSGTSRSTLVSGHSALVAEAISPFSSALQPRDIPTPSVFEIPRPLPTQAPEILPYDKAMAAYETGDYAQAETLLMPLQENPRAMLLLARVFANLGRLGEAEACCEKAIVADRINPVCQYLLGVILEELGQEERAIVAHKRALYLDPGFVLAYFALGNLARRRGEPDAARHYDNALEFLVTYEPSALLPESDGLTAGRLSEIIHTSKTATRGAA